MTLELELRRGGAEIGGEQIVTLFNNDTKVLRTNIQGRWECFPLKY